jgi:hypothetical protein
MRMTRYPAHNLSSIATTHLHQFADHVLSVKVLQMNLSYLNRGSSRASGVYVALSLNATMQQHFRLNSESFWDDDAYIAVTSWTNSPVDMHTRPTSAFLCFQMVAPLWLSSLNSAAHRVFDIFRRKPKNFVSGNANT